MFPWQGCHTLTSESPTPCSTSLSLLMTGPSTGTRESISSVTPRRFNAALPVPVEMDGGLNHGTGDEKEAAWRSTGRSWQPGVG